MCCVFNSWHTSIRGLHIAGAHDVQIEGITFSAATGAASRWGAAIEIANSSGVVVSSNVIVGPYKGSAAATHVVSSANNVTVVGNHIVPTLTSELSDVLM